ncbi:MAG TPA: glycosyltransferase [bacterium]|nr:glycosyltransferase [bacterium]
MRGVSDAQDRADVAVRPALAVPAPPQPDLTGTRAAFVHDWLVTLGGADRVLLVLHELLPQAPVYTALYDERRMPAAFRQLDVRPSWLQRIPSAVARHRWLVPLMAASAEGVDLRGYDLVISSSHAWAKGVRVPRGTRHICYCYTPMRYAWDLQEAYLGHLHLPARLVMRAALGWMRRWDAAAAGGVHHFIAISHFVASRIRRHYRREAAVIHPPVDTAFFTPGPPGAAGEFYLAAGRLVPYKRMDLAVAAFTRLGLPLVVVGGGPELPRLRALAGPTVRFAGEVSDEALREYYRRCRALVFPGVEDFGLVPVEAQACGRPVIAFGAGGALESVQEGVTGLFFRAPTADALAQAVRDLERHRFNPAAIRAHALRFSREAFLAAMRAFIAHHLA